MSLFLDSTLHDFPLIPTMSRFPSSTVSVTRFDFQCPLQSMKELVAQFQGGATKRHEVLAPHL
jgi:hypothetical protein